MALTAVAASVTFACQNICHNALPCKPCKPSCGSMSYPHVSALNKSSRSHHRSWRQHGLRLQLQCHLSCQYNRSRSDGCPSACTPERCLHHILPLYLLPIPSLPRALEFFFDDLLKDLVFESKVSLHLFQLAVLIFKFFETFDLTDLHSNVLGLPLTSLTHYVLYFHCCSYAKQS